MGVFRTNKKRRRKKGETKRNIIIGVILAVYCLITILPFYFLIIRSFTPQEDCARLHWWIPEPKPINMNAKVGLISTYYNLNVKDLKIKLGVPVNDYIPPYMTLDDLAEEYQIPEEKIKSYISPYINFNGWYNILSSVRSYRALFNTVIVTGASLLIGGFLSVLTGSVLAGLRQRWHRVIYNLYLLQMIIPPVMIMIPVYIIFVKHLHVQNSYWNLILQNIQGGALPIMVFTTHISTIPKELEESVKIDGGNRLQYLRHVVFPLSGIPFAIYTVTRLPKYWNELLMGLLYLRPEKYTIIPLLNSFVGEYTTNYQAVFAGLCFSMIPIVTVYLVFQNLFVKATLSGAIKG